MSALAIAPNTFGTAMTRAAYSPEGAEWTDALVAYLERNRQTFDAAIAEIPGVSSMPLEATYLSWVDFRGTGMPQSEIRARVAKTAKIAANDGMTFGTAGDGHLRFNFGMPHARVEEAGARLKAAFADLQ